MTDQKPPANQPGRPGAIPSDMKAFNQKLIKEFRENGGRLSGPMAGRKLMILTTVGAKSREARAVVVGYRPHGDKYLVIASDNGAVSHPAWYRNLLADPSATVEVDGQKFEASATTAGPEERHELAGKIDYLAQQQKLTSREIPIVILERG